MGAKIYKIPAQPLIFTSLKNDSIPLSIFTFFTIFVTLVIPMFRFIKFFIMKTNHYFLLGILILFNVQIIGAQTDSLFTVGKREFAISSNTYSMFQTIENLSTWNRSVYIYPKQALKGLEMSGNSVKIKAFQLYREVSRIASAVGPSGKFPNTAKTTAQIYMANTTLSDWSTLRTWDSVFLITKPTKVFDNDIKQYIDTTNGWKTIPFSAVFNYDTSKNLAIVVEYKQDKGSVGQIFWAYDSTHVKKGDVDTTNYFSRLQFKFCHKPFSQTELPINEFTGSNIRHPSIRFIVQKTSKTADISFIDNLAIFPNPVQNDLNVNILSKENMVVDIQIIDLAGHIFMQKRQPILRGYNRNTLKINNLLGGSYLLILSNGKEKIAKQFIKID